MGLPVFTYCGYHLTPTVMTALQPVANASQSVSWSLRLVLALCLMEQTALGKTLSLPKGVSPQGYGDPGPGPCSTSPGNGRA